VAELVGLRDVADEIARHGGRIFAVSVDRTDDSARVVSQHHLPFHILADVDRKVIAKYGLVHRGGGQKKEDIALPAHVLIDRGGRIAWRHIARRFQDRPYPSTILTEIQKLH
jgi:peroxiredoxin